MRKTFPRIFARVPRRHFTDEHRRQQKLSSTQNLHNEQQSRYHMRTTSALLWSSLVLSGSAEKREQSERTNLYDNHSRELLLLQATYAPCFHYDVVRTRLMTKPLQPRSRSLCENRKASLHAFPSQRTASKPQHCRKPPVRIHSDSVHPRNNHSLPLNLQP
jgi:hypothetical protein